jgi:hypothetical protein
MADNKVWRVTLTLLPIFAEIRPQNETFAESAGR